MMQAFTPFIAEVGSKVPLLPFILLWCAGITAVTWLLTRKKKRFLSLFSLVSAIAAPISYVSAICWLESSRSPADQGIIPLLTIIVGAIVWVLVTTVISIIAVWFDRKSAVAWSAAGLSLIQSSVAIYAIVEIKNLRF